MHLSFHLAVELIEVEVEVITSWSSGTSASGRYMVPRNNRAPLRDHGVVDPRARENS